MENIIVHNPCNQHTRYYRNYNLFWDRFTDHLKTKFNVEEDREYEFANSRSSNIFLKKTLAPRAGLPMFECEYIIEFKDTGDFYILSASDTLTSAILNERSNDNLKKVLVSQFNKRELDHHVGSYIYKYEPWIYFPSQVHDLEYYYNTRRNHDNFIDKMYFRGTALEDRPILSHLNPKLLEGIKPIGGPSTYFNDLIKYKIGLSVAGRGELCYRDIEYMAIGIPFLRFSYVNELNPNLIPNYHYIAVDRPDDLIQDRLGNFEHAKMIENKFLEVKDDKNFLNFIAKNARDYYTKYLSLENSINHTLDILNI